MANLITNSSVYLNSIDYGSLIASEQAQIDGLITAVSLLIERECNRIFLYATYTEEKNDGTGYNIIFVKNPPITTLTSIIKVSSTNTTVLATQFEFDANTGEIRWKTYDITSTADFIGTFPRGFNNILVNYIGGFAIVPEPIQMLAADMVIEAFDPGLSLGNIESEKLGQYFVKMKKDSFNQTLLKQKKIINLYKIIGSGYISDFI